MPTLRDDKENALAVLAADSLSTYLISGIYKKDCSDAMKFAETCLVFQGMVERYMPEGRILPRAVEEALVCRLLEERLIQRKNKNYDKADEIKDVIQRLGYEVQDDGEGTRALRSGFVFVVVR